jgi:predicted Zn-dependent peptidase
MKPVRASVVFCAALLMALPAAAQAPDRSIAPRPGPMPSFEPPAIQKRQLSNGVVVWIIERHEVPIVQVNLIIRAGSAADPAGKQGLASLTAAMLDEGAASRTTLEIADAVDFLGANLDTSSSFDASSVRLNVPVSRLVEGLAIMADVALRPTFPDEELERLRQQRLTALLQARDEPTAIVSAAFARMVFGASHRYGTGAAGTPRSIRALTAGDLREFHQACYRPDLAALAVVGDIAPDAVVKQLEALFGSWKSSPKASTARPVETARPLERRDVYLLDKPGAAQSQIRIGSVGAARSTADYFAISVLNTILGGSFTSRLNQNLRERNGYAYGAGSAFDMRASPGPFLAAAGVQTDKTMEALQEFFNEFRGILQPIPADELEKAKNVLALGFPGAFETTGGTASALSELIIYNLPDEHWSGYIARVRQVTADEVRRVAERYIQPTRFAVVVVGDLKQIEAKIKSLNLGSVRIVAIDEVMEPDGNQ